MYDIVIVGGGPAGATLARLLKRTYKILLLDKRLFNNKDRQIVKCCGGLLAPDAQKVIAQLGLGVPKETLVGPQLFTVRTLDFDNQIERYYQRHYINVDREMFDQWLVDLIPANVKKELGVTYKSFEEKSDGSIDVTYARDGRQYKVNTQYLVGADGGASLTRKKIMNNDPIQRYASIEEWYRIKPVMPYFTTIFDSDITDFYSWTIPKEEYVIVGSAIPFREKVNSKFQLLKEKLVHLGFKLDDLKCRQGAYILRPTSTRHLVLGKNNTFLLGESAGFISPSSAEGFSYAMRSAIALSNAFNNSKTDILKTYGHHCRKLRTNIMAKNMKSPFMYDTLLRKAVMHSGVLSMNLHSYKDD